MEERLNKLIDICAKLAANQTRVETRLDTLEDLWTSKSKQAPQQGLPAEVLFFTVVVIFGGTLLVGAVTNNRGDAGKAEAYREALEMQHRQAEQTTARQTALNAYVACLNQPPRINDRQLMFGLVRWTETHQPECTP